MAVTAAFLSGCGGTTATTEQLTPTRDTSPTVYGLQTQAIFAATPQFLMTSGLANPGNTVGYVTGAVDYVGTPIATEAFGTTEKIPLGFSAGGRYIDLGFNVQGAPPGGPAIFGASIANGNAANGDVIPVNPNGVTLTTRRADGSEEAPGFAQPLTFSPNTTGPLANATYRTAPFALPFATTGLHSMAVTATDARAPASPLGSSTTFFDVAVLQPEHAMVVLRVLPGTGASANVRAATATITNPVPGARQKDTTDPNDPGRVVVLFAQPGQQTITVTGQVRTGTGANAVTAPRSATLDVNLAAGQTLNSSGTGATQAPLTITLQAP